MKRPQFDMKCHRSGSGQHSFRIRPLFRDKIIHRTPVYDARTFLNFGRNLTNPGENPFSLSKIAHAAPQKKQPPQNGPCPSAIAASTCRKDLFSPLPLFSELLQVLKILDFNDAGNLSWVSRTHPSLPSRKSPPAALRLPPSAQPVSVCFAPENRGPSSKQARFIRPRRRFACFPSFLTPRPPSSRRR